MKRPVPAKPAELITSRTAASCDGRLLNASCSAAQRSTTPTICSRGRKPPTSMMGKRYRKPREMNGAVDQSTSAIVTMSEAASANSLLRFAGL
jgi:hypothetical protein